MEMDLGRKSITEFRTVFHSPCGVPNSQGLLFIIRKQETTILLSDI